ncbi:MAG: hypothetical protein U0R65_00270 [Candidatus Nanopelagicales bacterium]
MTLLEEERVVYARRRWTPDRSVDHRGFDSTGGHVVGSAHN